MRASKRNLYAFDAAAPPPTGLVDVGTAGWQALTPTARNTAGATLLSAAQPGSRLHYISEATGLEPVNQADALDMVYFWDGANIVDSAGSTTNGASVPYGTDPHLPSIAVRKFKSWGVCAPKAVTTETVYDIANNLIGTSTMGATSWRYGKPDWWLFERGQTHSLYRMLRRWLDLTGRAATAVNLTSGLLTLGGGAVIDAFGPLADGRARLIHALWAWAYKSPGGDIIGQTVRGLLFDGSDRLIPLRPVDWDIVSEPGQGEALRILDLGLSTGLRYEDCHFHEQHNQIDLSGAVAQAAVNATYDVTLHRNIVSTTWNERSDTRFNGRRLVADGDQALAPNTTTTLLVPTIVTSNAGWVAGAGTFTASSLRHRFWVLADVRANIAAGQTLRLGLFRDGVEIDATTVTSTGAGATTYPLVAQFRHGLLALSASTVFDVRLTSTGATGNVLVLAGTVQLKIISAAGGEGNGVYLNVLPHNRVRITENVFVRNGFGTRPQNQPTYLPWSATDAANGWAYDARSHNLYIVGEVSDGAVDYERNVSIVAAGQDVFRAKCGLDKNYIISGFGVHPEHQHVALTAQSHTIRDNVIEAFGAPVGNAHQGQGITLGTGAFAVPITGNIVTSVNLASPYGFGVKLTSCSSPYYIPYEFVWRNDTANVTVTGNQFDVINTGSFGFDNALIEANGEVSTDLQWNAPITGLPVYPASCTGATLTCTPTPGFTGTPVYQWVLYGAGGPGQSTTRTVISGANAAVSPAIQAAEWAFYTSAYDGVARNYCRLRCEVTGITYPPGVGLSGTIFSGNVVMKQATAALAAYYKMNAFSNPAPPPVTDSPSATSGATIGANSVYTTRALAATGQAWLNADACLRTQLIEWGIPVASLFGGPEYENLVVGANPMTNAMRRGQWYSGATAVGLVNYVRVNRGMSTV